MQAELRKKFSAEDTPPKPEPPKPDPGSNDPGKAAAQAPPPPEGDVPPAGSTPPSTTPDPDKKVSPWKLVDQFKQRATAAELRIAELEKQIIPEDKRKAEAERIAATEKRAQEMAEDLRYFNAEKYDPDIIKAQQTYDEAWKRAMSELGEITLKDPNTEQVRAVTVSDMLELVNLPLGRAREIADQIFGAFADDVMAHRKEIRSLFDAKAAKLEELKKNGAQREQQRIADLQRAHQEAQKFVADAFQRASAEALADEKHGQFFKPHEGDEEWNKRLEKGFKLVDEAYSQNAYLPNLSPEQRQAIIRKHAAVRNRAASWSALRYQNETLQQRLSDLETKLKQYQESTPAAGGRQGQAPAAPVGGMEGLRQDLRKLAH